MSEVQIRNGESFESALRRFKRQIEKDGILRELRIRERYEKPSDKKRRLSKRR